MLVGSIVIQNQMDFKARLDELVDSVEKPQELLMPVPRLSFSDHGAFELQRRKQCRRAVALVVVRLPRAQARTQRKDRLRFGPAPESGSSRPRSEQSLYPAGSNTVPRCREPSGQTEGRC